MNEEVEGIIDEFRSGLEEEEVVLDEDKENLVEKDADYYVEQVKLLKRSNELLIKELDRIMVNKKGFEKSINNKQDHFD